MTRHRAAPLAAVLLLAACGKPREAATTAQPEAAAPLAAATLTEAQKKALLATLPAAYQTADLDNGEAKFAICKSCHTTAQGGPAMTGPNLFGVFGRKAGASPGFAYSDALKASNLTWEAPTIDKWITNPKAMIPETKMTFIGMADAKDRTDLIAYLKVATSPSG